MTPDHNLPAAEDDGLRDGESTAAQHVMTRATLALKTQADQQWVEVSDRVLRAALTATRRSYPVRAQTPSGPVGVSQQVLVAHLRAAIDAAVQDTATSAVHIVLNENDTLQYIVVEIVAMYGIPLLPAADMIRQIAAAVLDDLLGQHADRPEVRVTHVHVADVTTANPVTGN